MIINYEPKFRDFPKLLEVVSAWGDIPTILKSIIIDFKINPILALEFGVEFGYSTSALSNYFNTVIGVDTFLGDIHTHHKGDHFESTLDNISKSGYENIFLVKNTYQEFIKTNNAKYDLIHIDIVHTYEDTFACGEWSINHSNVVIFHDTECFTDVRQACTDLSIKYDLDFYNYPNSYGLGILVKKSLTDDRATTNL